MDDVIDQATSLVATGIEKIDSRNTIQSDSKEETNNQNNPSINQDNYGFCYLYDSPFGGEARQARPPIGFNVGFLKYYDSAETSTVENESNQQSRDIVSVPKQPTFGSNESLYNASLWQMTWFLRCFILAMFRLLLFIRKIYEDYYSVVEFKQKQIYGYAIISLLVLILPTLVFSIYRLSRYLQTVLPASRMASNQNERHLNQNLNAPPIGLHIHTNDELSNKTVEKKLAQPTKTKDAGSIPDDKQQKIEGQARTALPTDIIPTKLDEYKPIYVKKLGQNQSAGIFLGACEQALHGVLYIFWQLKRQVDLVSYLVERTCAWRKPSEDEKDEINILSRHSDGLEFFQDFYSAFLAIIIQLCRQFKEINKLGTNQIPHLSNGRVTALVVSSSMNHNLTSENSTSNTGRLSHLFSFAVSSGEIFVSTLVIWSLLVAVRRRDDGIISLILSTIGWGCIFFSRLFIFSLFYSEFGPLITLLFVSGHLLGVTSWIYRIAIASHNQAEAENQERQWDIEMSPSTSRSLIKQTQNSNQRTTIRQVTDDWTNAEHTSMLSQIFFLFSIPSLFYWPFMFNLKLNNRPYKFMALILSENFLMMMMILVFTDIERTGDNIVDGSFSFNVLNVLVPVAITSILGFVFLCLYLFWKPSLTEYFARADTTLNDMKQSGIYYEFCSRVFKMPNLNNPKFKRLMNQRETQS